MPTSAVIHLIDDDDGVRRSLAFSLTTAGLAVRAYDSGTAFLDALEGLQPGCIVSDIRMPGMDGPELQRRLIGLGVKLPVIIMTGHADVRLAVDAMKAGAADFSRSRSMTTSCSRLSARRSRATTGPASGKLRPRRSANGSPSCRLASGRCSTASSPACPTRQSPMA